MAKQSRWRMDARDLKRRRQRQALSRRGQLHSAESLEARLALSVSSITNIGLDTNQAQGLPSDWVVILGSNADDVFIQRVATGEVANPDQQDLLVANNSSFLNSGPGTYDEVDDIDSLGSIYVTNGQEVTVTNVLHDQYPLRSVPAGVAAAGPWQTTFVLSRQQIEDTEECIGVITYGGNFWTFTNNVVRNSQPLADVYPGGAFTFTGPGYPAPGGITPPQVPIRPIGIAFADAASPTGDAVAIVTWSGFPVEALPTIPGPTMTITYDADNDQRGPVVNVGDPAVPAYQNYNQDFQTDVNRLPSAGALARFTVPVTNVHPGGIVNGTLQALVDVDTDGVPDFLLTPAQLFGPLENTLAFTDLRTGAAPALSGTFQTADNDSNQRTVSGFYDPLLGRITLQFFDGGLPQAVNGQVSIVQAQYATYDQDPLPMTATFFAGLDIHNEVYVDLLTSGSTINVENPIIQNAQDTELATGADIDLRATNVNIDATMAAIDEIRIGASRVVFPEIAQANAYAVIGAVGTPEEGQVVDIVVPAGWGGLGYTAALPVVVWIAPPQAGGTQAVANAVVQNGVVVSVTIVDPGSGYSTDPTFAPQVSISPPPALPPVPSLTFAPPFPVFGLPTPASAAFAVVGSDPDLPNYGQIIDVVMPTPAIYGGSGYDPANPPQVFIAPPPAGGTQAVVTAVVVGGVVVGFTIVDPGSGYLPGPTSPPAVSIAAPALLQNITPVSTGVAQGFAVITGGQVAAIGIPPGLGGQGYDFRDPPPVFIAPPPAGGTQATAQAVVENGVVVRIAITDPGAGYLDRPAVTIAPPPPMPSIGPGFIDPTTNEFPAVRATGRAPVAEQVSIDASVAAQFYDIRLGDDPSTTAFPRGQLFVSTSGSLSGAVPLTPGSVVTPAQRVFVQANNADVLIEGQVFAGEQTYLLQSAEAVDVDPFDGLEPEHEPYVFSTRSPATGSQTGLIRGRVVAVTLGNDAPTAEVGATALNIVDLQTRADSIRIKAATRAGEPLTGPFPYDLTIRDVDNVSFDAVAASGRPINLAAGGDIRFNAALATGSDLNIAADGRFLVTSPISSTRGQISISGSTVAVNNSLRVLDPVADPERDDISIRSTGGDLLLAGLVSAVNNVNLIQVNGVGPRTFSSAVPGGGLQILDNNTVEAPLTIPDDFTFTDVNVLVDLTHTFLGDLTIALVAPDGTSITLFDRNGGNGDNLVGTVFDTEAPTTLATGQAPFTGSFQPTQPLTPLYGGSTLGTWRLRITDSAFADTGVLLNFGLQFNIPGEQYGTLGGPARVVAERLSVEAGGKVSLFTNVDSLSGIANVGFTIDEQDDIAINSLRSGGPVSLRAAGVDPGLGSRYSDNAVALSARLIDVTTLEVSAPAGSVEITADTAQKLVLGRAEAIAAGLADPMKASGSVTIRSTAGDIDVLDAPLTGLPPNVVRVVTTTNLVANYAQNQPGTRASTLTATANGSLNSAGIDGVTNLRVGDRILVRNQANPAQNGIYVVTSLGGPTTRWMLTRAPDSDTPIELVDNITVTALDGGQAGKVFKFTYVQSRGSSPIGVNVVPNRPEAVRVRAATEASLFGAYDNATNTVTSVAAEGLPLINGVALQLGDRLLVRAGTHSLIDPGTRLPLNTTRVSNGVYEIVNLGGPGVPWQIQRIPEMDGFDDLTGDPVPDELLGYVNVREGTLSTAAVQGAYRLAYRSLGISPLTVNEVSNATEIGSDKLESLVTFVVSSAAGTNAAAGSLGKLVALRQVNETDRTLDGEPAGTQSMDFRFSTLIGTPIQLSQQLPEIKGAFVIDGGRRYSPAGVPPGPSARIVVDGSRITTDRFGRALFNSTLAVTRANANTLTVPSSYTRFGEVRVGMLVSGAQIKAGAKVLAINPASRSLTLTAGSVVGTGATSVTITTEVNGFDFRAGSGTAIDSSGVLQAGVVLANVNIGGFASGAAVSVNGGNGALIRNTILGQSATGSRLSNRFGVLVEGSTSSATILNNLIVGQSGAGVRVQDSASGVTVVGNTIGSSLLPNEVGVSLGSTGSNRVGVDLIAPVQQLSAVTVTRNLTANTITLPANYASFPSLFVNLGVKGPGVAAGARITAIDATTRVVTLTPGGVTESGTGLVTFGNLVDTTEFGRTIVLPAGVNIADVYLGLGVNGAGIRPGSTVTAIDVAARRITLSQEMTATASGVPVTFTTPGRNTISFNRYGMLLAAGANTVMRSNIFSNTFDGIRIVGGQQTIGTSKQYSPRSNSIYSNGGYGINIVAPAVATQQTIQGNYLGTPAPGTVRLVNRLGNINVQLPRWTPNAITNVDSEGNVHGPGNRSGLTGGGGSGGGGSGGGGTGGGSTNPPGVFPL